MVEPLGLRAWQAARGLIGVRFRLHGRDPATGLDCVGVIAAAYAAAGHRTAQLPDRYRLCGPDLGLAQHWLAACGAVPALGMDRAGDIIFADMGLNGRRQWHLLLSGPDGAIHAHAGLGRVVCSPILPSNGAVTRWRINEQE